MLRLSCVTRATSEGAQAAIRAFTGKIVGTPSGKSPTVNPVLPPPASLLYAYRAMKENQTLLTDAPAARPQNGTDPSRRILVVDDDVAIRQLSTELLIHFGYQVDAAEDGATGWEALHAKQYDLLITDNNMPNVSGIELVKKVRSAHMTLPVIMVSGTIPEELNRNPSLLDAALLKPFTPHELLETVNDVLRADESPRQQIHPPMTELLPSTDASTVRRSQSVLP